MEIQDIKNTDDLVEAIEDRAGVGLRDGSVPLGQKFAWFDKKVFELFKPVPITPQPLTVFAMFQDPDEVRVYAVIALELKEGELPPKDVAPYQRFTLSKHNPNMFIEVFPGTEEEPVRGLETFINLIVDDLQGLADMNEGAEAIDTLERAREAVAKGKIDEALVILKESEEPEDPPPPNGQREAPPPA